MTATEEHNQVLFVGSKRICPQIAYVLDISNYAMAEKLTAQNFDQYRDYQIYVCEFKRKSRRYVKVKVGGGYHRLNLRYLDDICRAVDSAYYANRKRYINHQDTKPKSRPVQRLLWHRFVCGIKHPIQAAWHVVLKIKHQFKETNLKRKLKHYQFQNRRHLQKYLHRMKPSELLLYVLRAPIDQQVQCTRLETNFHVHVSGDVKGCCSALMPFGNLLRDGELDEIYHSMYARIVKLSSLNRSYCLCNLDQWCKGYCAQGKPLLTKQWQTPEFPRSITLSFDRSCNLCCKSCRTKPYVMDEIERHRVATITTKLLRSGYIEQAQNLTLAGMGEVFYSAYYRQLLTTDLRRNSINILSNGTLFNESNWRLLDGKYNTIDVKISVDAATAETYQKLRGADFENLMNNLTMLSDLHRHKQIGKFGLNFVVQRDNFREMPAFIKLGQALGVDHVQFQRLNNWNSFSSQAYLDRCLLIDEKYFHYELWCVLQDPIFKDPIVDLIGLQRYIDASERRYRRRYEKEQRQRRSV